LCMIDGGDAGQRFNRKLGRVCELIVIAGNHDRHLRSWYSLSHGNRRVFIFPRPLRAEKSGRIEIIGHYHQRESCGMARGWLKFPAFVQRGGFGSYRQLLTLASGTWTQRRVARSLRANHAFAVGILYRRSAFRAKRRRSGATTR
jgi:hypothetical protein